MFQTTNQTMIVVDNTMFLISGAGHFWFQPLPNCFLLIPPSPSDNHDQK